MQKLIQAKVKLDDQDILDGDTALIKAISKGYLEIAHDLIVAKANLDIRNRSDGNTALILAAAYGHLEIARELIMAKANLNIQSRAGNTALLLAIDKDNIEIAHALIAAKANPDIISEHGSTALHCAIYKKYQEIASELIRAQANLNIQDRKYGDTPLIIAAYKGNREIVKELIEAKAVLDIKNKEGNTALDEAVKQSHLPIISLLLNHKANIQHPQKLFDFLQLSDQRDPDVLVSLRCLCEQLGEMAHKEKQEEELYIKAKTYLEKLTILTNAHQEKVMNEVEQTIPTIPPELLNMFVEYDSPLESSRFLFFTPTDIDSLSPVGEHKEETGQAHPETGILASTASTTLR